MFDAITQLSAAGVKDLVLDMRYNGGGYLAIASQLGYMIAGPGRTTGKTFEEEQFNDKPPTTDPVTGQAIRPTPFLDQTIGLSLDTLKEHLVGYDDCIEQFKLALRGNELEVPGGPHVARALERTREAVFNGEIPADQARSFARDLAIKYLNHQ